MCLSSESDSQNSDDGDHLSNSKSVSGSKRKIEETSGEPSQALSPKKGNNNHRLKRSNSKDQLGEDLSIGDRKTGQIALKEEAVKDYSVIAAFSREAFENFGKKWRATMNGDSLSQATKSSRLRVKSTDATELLGRQSKVVVGANLEVQMQALFEGKTNPHVIAVIEGKEEAEIFSLKIKGSEQSIDMPYTKIKYYQGTNAKGYLDNKQSMSVYVRNDMKKVYSVTEEKISHSGKSIASLGINYHTADGTYYRTLLVHIPNDFIGTASKNSATHNSFEKYALDLSQSDSPVVVTSYFGDTNYANPMSDFSVASMGGHSSTGDALNPQGSGAQSETHFMQSVALGQDSGKHSVKQPSTLNYVFINSDIANREVTDHPSILQYVAHDSELEGRQGKSSIDFVDAE